MLDIDGVLLPRKSYLIENNIKVAETLKEKQEYLKNNKENVADYLSEYQNIFYEYAENMEFDKNAINLINRLAEKSHAKIVVLSNWRRRLSSDKLVEILIDKGIKKEYFHSAPCAPFRMTSEKIHDLYMWLDNQKLNEENSKVVVIDDEHISSVMHISKNIIMVNTHFDEGFTVSDYCVAAGFLEVEDKMFSVVQLSDEELSIAKDYIFNQSDIYSFMYGHRGTSGLTQPRASYFSKKEAERIIKEEGDYFRFFGYGLGTSDELYSSRKQSVMNDFEKYHGKTEPKHESILIGNFRELEKFKIDGGDFEKHPKSYPALIIGDGEKGFEYIYPPEDCNDPVEYLNGYYDSLTQFDEHK